MTRYLTIDGCRLEVAWTGESKGELPVLVFLHEGLGCCDMWHSFPETLARATGTAAFVFSRAGYGRSDPCRLPRKLNFLHHEALHVLPRLLERAGIQKHILIGHSDGGSIGIIYAGSPFARNLAGLITEAAHVFCESVTLEGIQAAGKAYASNGLREKLLSYHGANTDTAFRGWYDAWLNPRFSYWNIEKYLKRIQVPVLAIQGLSDPYGTLAQLAAMDRGVNMFQSVVVEDCGHCPHREKKDVVRGIMVDFILGVIGGLA